MRNLKIALGIFAVVASGVTLADLKPFTDYEVSEHVWTVSTIRVHSNMGDAYLEGIRETWAASNDIAKELGQIEDYMILRSDLPDSGDFNLLLMTKLKSTADLGPSKKRYDAFMKAMGEQRVDNNTDFAQENYPAMRDITGQYNLREITLK